MPDLSTLLSKPAGEAKKPPPLPPGNYPLIIKSYESVTSKKKTPGLQFNVAPTAFPDDIDADEYADVDLTKKTLRHTQYLSEDSMWSLDEFLRDTLKMDVSGKSYEELIPETVGCELMGLVENIPSQRNPDEMIAVLQRVGPKD